MQENMYSKYVLHSFSESCHAVCFLVLSSIFSANDISWAIVQECVGEIVTGPTGDRQTCGTSQWFIISFFNEKVDQSGHIWFRGTNALHTWKRQGSSILMEFSIVNHPFLGLPPLAHCSKPPNGRRTSYPADIPRFSLTQSARSFYVSPPQVRCSNFTWHACTLRGKQHGSKFRARHIAMSWAYIVPPQWNI